jgi:cob(I)alamin adenosyltransferase
MKIATKTGDNGTTGLLYGGRHEKSEILFDVLGDLDELSAFIGMAKVSIKRSKNSAMDRFHEMMEKIQKDIIAIMGELNCDSAKSVSHYINKFDALKNSDYDAVDEEVSFLQNIKELEQKGWVLYGKTGTGASFDICSKVCRRAERSYWKLQKELMKKDFKHRDIISYYINRLSDLFYLLARLADH